MDGDVAFVAQQGVTQGSDKHTRATHLRQRPRQDVTVSTDVDQFHRETSDGGQLVSGLLRLGEGELAGARSDPDRHCRAASVPVPVPVPVPG